MVRQAYVEKVDNKTLMRAAISGMLTGLDPHSEYLDKEGLQALTEDTTGAYSGLGIEVIEQDGALRIIAPIDDTPASRAGIKPGDLIVKIDGKPVTDENIDTMFKNLRGEPGSKITLTIVHEKSDKLIDLPLVREKISVTSVRTRELEPGYAYIRISQFQEDTAPDLEKKLAALIAKNGPQKGAVLDLRSNPGGLLTAAVGVSDDLLDSGTIVTTRGRLADANLSFSAHPGDILNGAPLVLLADNGTASAAEIVSGALKDNHRALIIGKRTFGKGVVQTVLPLDADHAVKITTARYYTPNGTSIQAEGIKPDIALADLTVNKADTGPQLITSEADLSHHLANEDGERRQGHQQRRQRRERQAGHPGLRAVAGAQRAQGAGPAQDPGCRRTLTPAAAPGPGSRPALLATVCHGVSGLLLADWPRPRMGADAAEPGPGRGPAAVESARPGPPDRQDSPRPARQQ